MPSSLISLVLLLFVYLDSTKAQTLCNGYADLCSRQYSNITTIGTHDSAFVGELPQDNQDISVTAQLDAGIRFLQPSPTKIFLEPWSFAIPHASKKMPAGWNRTYPQSKHGSMPTRAR